ncbi:MAG: low molecular weight protein-tyrosine-phosphatase, partial [Pseudomonadales bacterium]
MAHPIRVLTVCLGNICRSPSAQGVLEKIISDKGLTDQVVVDSAGTANYHCGSTPDRRATAAARARGIDLSAQRARQLQREDFTRFDYILVMDSANLADVQALQPESSHASVGYF